MGVGGEKKPFHEIDDTRGSAADDRFEMILRRVEKAGADITLDEESPLYTDIGMQQFEIGYERIVEFNLYNFDFRITRDVKTVRLSGTGKQKHLEDLPVPSVQIHLKRKPDTSQQWLEVDLEDLGF